ncbi:hypothetical protein DMI60_27880 [Escherichia coli]|nr:hypothetical protein [Escherichia coli]
MRPEATGYGLVYFTEAMLKRHGMGFEGMRVSFLAPATSPSTLSKKRWNLVLE